MIFAGFVSDIENVYAALDVFLLPPLFRSAQQFPARRDGLRDPLNSYPTAAPWGEILEDGHSGLLVEAAKTPRPPTQPSPKFCATPPPQKKWPKPAVSAS